MGWHHYLAELLHAYPLAEELRSANQLLLSVPKATLIIQR